MNCGDIYDFILARATPINVKSPQCGFKIPLVRSRVRADRIVKCVERVWPFVQYHNTDDYRVRFVLVFGITIDEFKRRIGRIPVVK